MVAVPSKKGLSFLAVRNYVTETSGSAAWEQSLASLCPKDREELRTVVGMGWYPLTLYAGLVRAVDDLLGTGDLALLAPMVYAEAERDLPTIHRVLLQLVRPTFVITKMGDLWSRYNSTGRFVVELKGDRAVEATILDWSDDRVHCLGTQYYCERALQLAGARRVRIAQPRCRSRGDAHCLVRATWDARSFGQGSLPPES
jgi:hypothetical protein